jgi:hypothetical protein
MNIAAAHLDALKAFGYTEDEARFLYIVATHSGYFVARQFLAFTGAHWGKRTTMFWHKLRERNHARIDRFPKSGVVCHLFSRRLYRQMERENIRNRRDHEIEFIRKRVAILDFVLENQTYSYLETEAEKVRFFCGTLGIDRHILPARLYVGRPGSRPTVRYFVDKFPMFAGSELSSSSPVVTFTYVKEGQAAFADFVHHLESYLPLFRQLSDFRFLYVSRTNSWFEKATEIFNSLVKIPLESDIAGDLIRYFRVRRAWDEKRYAAVTDADLIFRNEARKRFSGDRFEGLYRGWKNERIAESAIRQQFVLNDRKRAVGFDTYLLQSSASTDGGAPQNR